MFNASTSRILYRTIINVAEIIMVFPVSRPGAEQQILDLASLSTLGKGDSAGQNWTAWQIARLKQEF
jgi:hypothetical protein